MNTETPTLAPHLSAELPNLVATWPDAAWKAGETPDTLVGTIGKVEVTLVRAHVHWMAFSAVGKGMGKAPVEAIHAMR